MQATSRALARILKGHVHLALVMLLATLSPIAQAADPLTLKPGMVGVPDLGALQCETFNQMYPNGPTGMRQAVLTWAQGYFFARSGKTTDAILADLPADSTWDFDSLSGHLVAYCEATPDASVPEAVADLWSSLNSNP